MMPDDNSANSEEKLIFAEETDRSDVLKPGTSKKFKLLIVDDEKEVHVMTKFVLADYVYNDYSLEFFSAYSGKEARELIREHPDAACILLDVVMEEKNTGLDIVKFIREDEKNNKIRIILRTGQPGKAPEKEVILNYDINAYKEKTELTNQKLFTTVTTALRSFLHLTDLEAKNKEIAAKNIRLNEEIARRIVAESNLTKYNRSLEKMIESKSSRLKQALDSLKEKEKELIDASRFSSVGQVSSASIEGLDFQEDAMVGNIQAIDRYRSDMTRLIEKYETLHKIIQTQSRSCLDIPEKTFDIVEDLARMKTEIDLEQILKKYPEIIKDSLNSIQQIYQAVGDIKRFMAITSEPRDESDINRILKKAAKKIKPDFDQKIDLQMTLGDIPRLDVAPKKLRKAFGEILKNAFQSVKSKGIVSVSTTWQDPDIVVEISDIGNGIPSENLSQVFTPYFTSGKEGAKGLGLTYARSVIVDNHGVIEISSTAGEGTDIRIRFPKPDLSPKEAIE